MGHELSKVDEIIESFGNNKEALIQILLDVQREYRWLSKPVLGRISERLRIPTNHIYHITTFYKYFNLIPQGRHSISVCLGTACHVRGAMRLLDRVSQAIGVKPGQTTPDQKFTLSTVNCLGCCALGPVVVIDKDTYGRLNQEKVAKLLDQYE
ncbi:MAG: NADH-quinone oxidoreductase subunit NuoE [Thermodesulfobacteriota bacterium]